MTDLQRLQETIDAHPIMSIALVLADGTPWVVPVRIQVFKSVHFEWDSKVDTIHSEAMRGGTPMAITVYRKHDSSHFGMYAVGTASLVVSHGDRGRYRFTATRAWVNDETFRKREIDLADTNGLHG